MTQGKPSEVEYWIMEHELAPQSVARTPWEVTVDYAKRYDGHSFQHENVNYFRTQKDQDALTIIKSKQDWPPNNSAAKFVKSQLAPGSFYSRMSRPTVHNNAKDIGVCLDTNAESAIAKSITQLTTLVENLKSICQTVHPEDSNLEAYGHQIRNDLILSCTEVEAQWAGVLRASNYKPNERLTTNDYVKLAKTLRLREFSLRFAIFPWLGEFRPFDQWDDANPTKSLVWYNAYNGVKHDRETSFSSAKLKHLFDSIAACYVLLTAQYGTALQRSSLFSDLRVFELIQKPYWPPEEVYFPKMVRRNDGALMSEWNKADYSFP